MNKQSEQFTDTLETLILMSLDANHNESVIEHESVLRDKKSGAVLELLDQGYLLRFEAMSPSSAYTFDATDDTRILAAHKDLLLYHPSETLGNQSEVIMLSEHGSMKWYGFRRLNKAPRGVSCLGKPSHWYEMHLRTVLQNGRGSYYKRIVPLNKNGSPLPAMIQNACVCSPNEEGVGIVACASVIEDAHRSGTMLAEVKEETEIKLPVPIDDYKAVFSERDGPIAGSKKKAIIHWVAKHLRRSSLGKEHEVKRHTRGIQEFVIDGIRVRLTPNGA